MKQLLLILPSEEKTALGSIRCMPGLLAAEQNGMVYVKGIDAFEDTDMSIKQLPVMHTYILDEQDNLFPPKGFTPVGRLQQLDWQPLHQFIQAEMPVAALPGVHKTKMAVKPVPSQNTQPAGALLTTLDAWKAYAESAPEVRLACTRFAISETGEVLITGNPLPPVQGKEYWLQKNILLPAGYDFAVRVMHEIISAKLNPENDLLLLFDTSGGCEEIPAGCFVKGSRSAIRLTNINATKI